MTSVKAAPRGAIAGRVNGTSCSLAPEKLPATKAVHAVEAVRVAEEVGRGLRRAADAGELGDAVRRHVELEERLDDRARDRVVPAARAQRRHRPFIVAVGVAELVLRKLGVVQSGLGEISHGATLRSGVTLNMASFSPISRRMNRAVIGV